MMNNAQKLLKIWERLHNPDFNPVEFDGVKKETDLNSFTSRSGDTVTIRSPGTPPDPITIEQLQCFSAPMVSRNPRLHAVFSTMELAEERGLGLKSMRTTATEAGLPLPKFRFNEPYLDLVIYRTEEAVIGALAPEVQKQLSKDESERFKWVARRETTMKAVALGLTPLPARDSAGLTELRRHLNAVRYLDRALRELRALRLEEVDAR